MTDNDIDRSGCVSEVRVESLERIARRAKSQVWSRIAPKYGVSSPAPPWKSSLDGICDALDRNDDVLPLLERRREEDLLSERVYTELPFPERQLVALAHSLVAHGAIDEAALARRMETVRCRLEAGGSPT